MRRRSFLTAIAAAFVAPDPERLLWEPKKKLISIPAPRPVVLPVPIAWEAIIEDVTTLASHSPWRMMRAAGYIVHFSDGTLTVVSPAEHIRLARRSA